MNTKNLIRLLLRQDFNKAIGIQIGLCTRIGDKAEFADVVFDALRFELLFRSADPGDFGVCVNDGGDRVVVDVAMACLDVLNSSNTWT